MPAYISLSVEFSRYELDYDTVKMLKSYLDYAGLRFKCGVNESENESIEEINDWNQKKLEDNYTLGYTDHRSNNYKQACFEYGGFSEIRGYFINGAPTEKEFKFTLVFPEEEVVNEDGSYKADAVQKLKDFARILWVMPQIRTIQTEREESEGITPENEILTGVKPSACPFAIVSQKMFGMLKAEDYDAETINAGGVIIVPKGIVIR
ncbi:MAG: hypothetical protein IJ779_05380 [Ruminococcus sp.]|nr:hypothetical protein [Ruminococcus sp.]